MLKIYRMKNNSILVNECSLLHWHHKLKNKSRKFNNRILDSLPEDMFKQEEDRQQIKLIEEKSLEIIEIYKKLYKKFISSLTHEQIKLLP